MHDDATFQVPSPGLVGATRTEPTSLERILAHPIRRAIVAHLTLHPGDGLAELGRRLHVNRGTIAYHVGLLERSGILKAEQGHSHHCFLGSEDDALLPPVGVLREGRTMEIVAAVVRNPGVIQKELTASLRMSRKVIRSRLDLLREQEMVDEHRDARCCRYFPTGKLIRLLADIGHRTGRSPSNRP